MADAAYHKITQELAESRDFPSDSEEEAFHDLDMEGIGVGDVTQPKSGHYERLEPDSAPPAKSWTKLTAVTVISLVVIAIIILAVVAAVVPREQEKFPYSDIRLPKDIMPETYDIFLHPNLTTQEFTGSVEITIRVAKATSVILLHMQKLSLTETPEVKQVVGKRDTVSTSINVAKTLTDEDLHMLYIGLTDTLQEENTYSLTLNFKGDLSGGLSGFYKSRYKTSTGEERLIATTQFEPTDARRAFPCFDEPDFKATFTMSIVHDNDHIALFNMPLLSTEKYKDTDLKLDKFDTTLKMSTYLIAFIVCDFKYKELTTTSGIKVRVYAAEDHISEAEFAVDAGAKIISHYEDFFQVPYPLPKQDMVAIPDFSAGAMENWGLITYRETAILYKDGVSSDHDLQWVGIVIAHELAHQWFGNLVTMEWWNDLWLNEGFASYVEYIGTNYIQPEWKMMDQFLHSTLQRALVLDALSNSHPISVPVSNPEQINEIFDDISYDKGASIIRMLANYLTDTVFQNGLTYYLTNNSYGNAKTDDLWAALTKADEGHGDTQVKSLMDTWTLQMGYPVVTLTKNGNKVTATQQRFLIYPDGEPSTEYTSPFNYEWIIPFTYILSDGSTQSVLIDSHSVDITLTGDPTWIKGNTNSTGYYRVNYDTNNWNAIIQQFGTDHTVFNSADRTSIIDDIFHLARAGHVGQIKALDFSLYLTEERDYVPLVTAIGNLNFIGDVLLGMDGYTFWKQYMLQQFNNIIDEVGWNDTGTHIEKFRRAALLQVAFACGHEGAVNNSVHVFQELMTKGTAVSANLKDVIYCAGVRYGGDAEFQYMWGKYQDETVATEKRKLLRAVTCTRDETHMLTLLESSLDETKIRSQDTESVIAYIASNPYNGQQLAWDFVSSRWNILTDRYAGNIMMLTKIIKAVAPGFSTEDKLQMLENFFAQHLKEGLGVRAINQSLEKVRSKVAWMKTNEDIVTQWLKDNVNPALVPPMIE